MQLKEEESKVENLLKEFRKLLKSTGSQDSDHDECQKIFSELKILMIKFNLIPPFPAEKLPTIRKHLALARETYELGAFLSIEKKDEISFERFVSHLKTYYNDYSTILAESEWKWPILGLHLMALLAQNRIADFHTELELVPLQSQDNRYITFPVELERWLMEGSYNKVLSGRPLPLPVFSFFMDQLMATVQEKMAACIEKAYETFPINQAMDLLGFESKQVAFEEYCKKRNWDIKEEISFNQGKDENLDIPAHATIKQSLIYATELERIV